MPYRTFDFSSDVGVEGEALSVEQALVEIGRAMAHIITDGSKIQARTTKEVSLVGARDVPGTAVAWINELVFLFDTEQFLLSSGDLRLQRASDGLHHITGIIQGEGFDPARHASGRGVKAATLHDAEHQVDDGRHRLRLVLDL